MSVCIVVCIYAIILYYSRSTDSFFMASTSMLAHYICKNTKNIQKCDLMNEFCLQDEHDLTLFLI